MLLLQQMIVLFLLMGIGLLCRKKDIITGEVSKKLSAIVVNIANPAMVLSGAMGEDKIQGKELFTAAIVTVAVYAVLVVLAQLIPVILKVEKKSRGTYKAMTIFSNIGFMGFPVVASLYGNSALLYAALFTIPYNVLIYTYGVASMTTGGDLGEQEKDSKKNRSILAGIPLKRIFNVGVIACIVTIAIYLSGLQMPVFVKSTVEHLSSLTAPLSMMVIGASLADIDMKKLFTDVRILIFSAIKLLVIPVAGVFLIKCFVDNQMLWGVCMVMLATPVGSMTAMLAQQYEGDYEMASKGVALTTILSVVTIPLVSMLVL